MRYAAAELRRAPGGWALDVGCGAARNAAPLASMGWRVLGTDLSWPMAVAARERVAADADGDRLRVALAPMEALPVRDRSVELIVAHGIWNLATSGAQFRRSVAEAARVALPGAGLFVFTFSRNTFAPDTQAVAGESFVFTQFSGRPQCFLTAGQLDEELGRVGFEREAEVPLREYNVPPPGALRAGGPPVIYEAAFRFRG